MSGAPLLSIFIFPARCSVTLLPSGHGAGAVINTMAPPLTSQFNWSITMKAMNLRSLSIAAVCALGVLTAGSQAWARPGGAMGGPFAGDLFSTEKLAADLELSETQRSAVEHLMDESRKQARPYVRRLLEHHKAMRTLTEADSFDEAAVRSEATQGATAMTELAVLRARNLHELQKLLTPAQREKLQDRHGRRHRH